MGLEELIGEAGKTLLEKGTTALAPDTLKKGSEALLNLEGRNALEVIDGIQEHLRHEERLVSVSFIDLFAKSTVLDKELGMIEMGAFNQQTIESAGFPVMVDVTQTTPEMILADRAVLTP